MTSYKDYIVDLDLESKNIHCIKFEQDQANILPNMQVSSLFYSRHTFITKVAMAIPEVNENCHHVQMTPISVELNSETFIVISCGVTELLRN